MSDDEAEAITGCALVVVWLACLATLVYGVVQVLSAGFAYVLVGGIGVIVTGILLGRILSR